MSDDELSPVDVDALLRDTTPDQLERLRREYEARVKHERAEREKELREQYGDDA